MIMFALNLHMFPSSIFNILSLFIYFTDLCTRSMMVPAPKVVIVLTPTSLCVARTEKLMTMNAKLIARE